MTSPTNDDSPSDEREDASSPAPADAGVAPAGRTAPPSSPSAATGDALPTEIGGQKGPEPTRYGDWEKKGRCTDF